MPVVKKSAAAVAKSPAKNQGMVQVGDDGVLPAPGLILPDHKPAPREAVTFAENVLTVDLTALDALPQGKRQAAVKVARNVLDRASQ